MSRAVKCPDCEGTTWNIVTEPCSLYKCGTSDVAVRCKACNGTGLVITAPSMDGKTLAAGD